MNGPDGPSLLVVDASVFVEVLLQTTVGAKAAELLIGRSLVAPGAFDTEVLHALRGLDRGGMFATEVIDGAVRRLGDAPLQRRSGPELLAHAWALRHRFSAYDAMYLALAMQLRCPVLTSDARWQRAGDVGISILTVS